MITEIKNLKELVEATKVCTHILPLVQFMILQLLHCNI